MAEAGSAEETAPSPGAGGTRAEPPGQELVPQFLQASPEFLELRQVQRAERPLVAGDLRAYAAAGNMDFSGPGEELAADGDRNGSPLLPAAG